MDRANNKKTMRLLDRIVIGLLVLLAALLAGLQAARAAEIVPAVGFTRPTHGDGDLEKFYSLGLRSSLIPLVKTELAIGYTADSYFNNALNVREYPLTASVWVTPVPTFYIGGGVGLYHTKFDYQNSLMIPDETSNQFGTHVGGGVSFPVIPAIASVDLNVRYVRLGTHDSPLSTEGVRPSFFSTALGVAFKF